MLQVTGFFQEMFQFISYSAYYLFGALLTLFVIVLLLNALILFLNFHKLNSNLTLKFKFPLLYWIAKNTYQVFNIRAEFSNLETYIKAKRSTDLEVRVEFIKSQINAYFTIRKMYKFRASMEELKAEIEILISTTNLKSAKASNSLDFRHVRYISEISESHSINKMVQLIKNNGISTGVGFSFCFEREVVENETVRFTFRIFSKKRPDIKYLSKIFRIFFRDMKTTKSLRKCEIPEETLNALIVLPYLTREEIVQLSFDKRGKLASLSSVEKLLYDLKLGTTEVLDDFQVFPTDLVLGGIISGGIGSGKTNFRLLLMKMLREAGISIIDIDFKGDAPRMNFFRKFGRVIAPKLNLQINPFEKPVGMNDKDYSQLIFRSFVETLGKNEELSPPQKQLLGNAIYETIKMNGNSYDFFDNLFILATQLSSIIDNNQDYTAIALFNKLSWLCTSLRDVFWVEKSNLKPLDFVRNSIHLDLSEVTDSVTIEQLRFLVDIIMLRFTMAIKNEGEYHKTDEHGNKLPRYVIFLDEAQLLMPARGGEYQSLTRMEEIVSTLRYKGVSVVASGISANLMSAILLDSGFLAQFRTESEQLTRALGINEKFWKILPKLPNYHAIVKSPTTNYEPLIMKTEHCKFDKVSEKHYKTLLLKEKLAPHLENFELSNFKLSFLSFLGEIKYQISRPLKDVLETEAKRCINDIQKFDVNSLVLRDENVIKICNPVIYALISRRTSLHPLILENSELFFIAISVEFIRKSFEIIETSSLLNTGIGKKFLAKRRKIYKTALNFFESSLLPKLSV